MAKQIVDALVEGGKASAAPPLGPALGPLGINIGQVIADINKKTADFKGVQVPVKIIVDENKNIEITVGTPPASALIKQEAHIEKGSGSVKTDLVADIKIEQVIKIAKMKQDNLFGKDMFARVKEIAGTCNSMGVMIEGKRAIESITDIDSGMFDEAIKSGRTELSEEAKKELETKKKALTADIEKRKAAYEAQAKAIIEQNAGQTRGVLKAKLIEAKVPATIYEPLLPAETAATAAKGAAPAKDAGKKK
ncbi:50S ribosomal protein L11 [Candidatus Woesearchaeota archaeon CG10_big_fil_rev_8_21_14_0_10_37_12]|nr:MAG: 50S ribosomal protein L11 [Candidatus Woesearchaeota archaeon CG10_big_fil_rev_8_21_14_0_10_37_12]